MQHKNIGFIRIRSATPGTITSIKSMGTGPSVGHSLFAELKGERHHADGPCPRKAESPAGSQGWQRVL